MSVWSAGSAMSTSFCPTLRVMPRSMSDSFCSFVPLRNVHSVSEVQRASRWTRRREVAAAVTQERARRERTRKSRAGC